MSADKLAESIEPIQWNLPGGGAHAAETHILIHQPDVLVHRYNPEAAGSLVLGQSELHRF